MQLLEFMKKYYRLKNRMETSGIRYGLNDQRTIGLSKELDLLIVEIMKIKYPGSFNRKEIV
ncbi:aspartyl-phosphate phosphatase Spo0E family protein [Peribacillus asahii]|uniref:aspartyl-phosphate phosphatase Spo0E family protein n=1 Tax=Peribacillus asahii TaxID=228899 RepID=UPI0020792C75|nr:aspartyl-phosphate phosphatase Spo0E family protein [Peribacillus asahii]USK68693.1 aspartyl-phosphate phosphatase Spo0E family protein [Peribacillus asahii]